MRIVPNPKWDFWVVRTPGKGMGMTVHMDKETGAVIHAGRWPR